MKALLEKIRKILRNRRTRQLLARTVSGFAAVVVFVTTYALVLPAITMEQEASCGITAHEHTDACYEERLVCQIPEDENHHHDASCYEKFLICGQQVHVHSTECYQQYTSAVVSSGSTTAASTDLGALVESELYSRDDSGDDAGSILTDSGSNALETVEEDSSASVEDSDLAADTNPVSEGTDPEASGNGISENTDSVTTNPADAESQSFEENRITASEENRDAAPEENESVASEGETGSETEDVNDEKESLGLETADSPDLSDGSGSVSDASDRSAADTSDAGQEFNDSAAGTSDVKTENAETTDVESAKTAYTESAETAGTEAAAQEAANNATTNVLPEAAENENLTEGYVPELDSIEFGSVLNKHTDFYYFHPEEGQEIPASSAEITDWKKVKNDLFGSTKLESADLVKLYLSYTIPAGALNETNQVARYRLPSNIHLTDEQIIAINSSENGMSALYAEADPSDTGEAPQDETAANYQKYLGVEAIEGTRTPERIRKEDEQEYISAIVKAENVFDEEGMYGEKGAFLGQDLIYIFTPYSIEKNQTTYNADGNPLSAGEKITGWFACDFNMSQIDWMEEDTDLDNSTVEKTAEIVFAEKDSEKNLKEISRTLKLVDVTEGESDTAGGVTASAAETAAVAETASAAKTATVSEIAGTADTVSENASADETVAEVTLENAENGPFKSGTLTANGNGYRITLDYTEKAKIPENAELSVREITAETDREAYEACLEQAGQQVASDEKTGVDQKASRFFDIEILVKDTEDNEDDGKGKTYKIEPSAPVSVNIQIIDDQASEDAVSADQKASQGDPAVLHFAEEGVEQIDSTVKNSQEQVVSEGKDADKESEPAEPVTEISFEAESFSIYGVVYTVDFHYEVNGKMYQVTLPGGGFASFTDLVEVLGITDDKSSSRKQKENRSENTETTENAETAENAENPERNPFEEKIEESSGNSDTITSLALEDVEVSEATRKFVADVASVEFSSPELVDVSKVENETTVGDIRENRGLVCQYSAELSEEQIAEINNTVVEAGDWALISLLPFTSEEELTVTMNDGDMFSIRVTDAQIRKTVIDAKGDTWEITVTYGEDARIPDGAELKVEEILPQDEEYDQYYQQSLEKICVSAQETAETADTSAADVIEDAVEEPADLIESKGDEEETAVPAKKVTADYARFFNIEIWADGQKIEPAADVTVNIMLLDAPEKAEASLQVVHFAKDGAELMELKEKAENSEDEGIQFVTDEFSVYSVVYTVDFSYQVNGKVYEFTMQGADSVSLRALIDALHVYKPFKKENTNASGAGSKIEAKVTNADLAEQASAGNVDLDSFMSDIKTVTFSNEELLVPAKVEEDTTAGKIKTDLKLFPTYPLGLKQSEVLALNAKEYAAGDWALISMKAFSTLETLTITMITGETFKIKVTDAQDAVMIGDQVQTISNPAGTTIDLFDYWIVSQDLVGRDGWGDLNQDWGGHPDTEGDNGYNLNGSGNNKGINSSDVDSVHGHALKFSPAWDGTVYNGTKEGTHRYYPNWDSGDHNTYYDVQESWRSLNQQGKDGLNSYTGDADPFQGIVGGTLVNGYPVLTSNDTIGSNGESLAYLFDTGFPHAGKASYPGVNQLLYVDKEGYYTYDSRDYRADYNNGTFVLTEQTSDNTEIRGFWPFGTQNFWAGLHINTQFSMPVNGQVLNPSGEYKDMQFEFSGDDDTWLYVDGVLVGDGGGIHNRTEIDVNFSKGTVTVTGKKGGGHSGDFEETKYLDDIFTAAGKYNEDQWEEIGDGSGHKRFKPGTYHTFDMFYLERGGGESNLYIHYNLVSTADFTAHKSYYGEDETDLLRRDQFQFELTGLDGKYRSVMNAETGNYELRLEDPSSEAIMPHASGSGEGTVASPHYEDNVTTILSSGPVNSQIYITGVSEDGNINFGTAEISEMDMHDADEGNPPVYKYIIREIVPDDAVNQDGITWASATDAQKAAGGFVKDHVTYDGTIYYMTGRVTSWTETNASGQEVPRHGISKTYYTDDTYSTVKSDVNFASFENRFTPDFGNVDFRKVDGAGEPLEGAVFTLFKDEACTVPAADPDTEGHPVWTATSDENGIVSFEHIRTGIYYMKETEAPDDYVLDETIYKVIIEKENDHTKQSKITIKGDETETPVTSVANAKSGKITVLKKWLNEAGAEVDGGSNSVTVQLKRKHMVAEETESESHTLTITQSVMNYGSGDQQMFGAPTTKDISGDNVVIEWDDEWQDNFNWTLKVGTNTYEGYVGNGNTVSGPCYTIEKISVDGRSRRLTVTNIDGDVEFTTKYHVNWLYTDQNHWRNLNSPVITDSSAEPSYIVEEDTVFNNENHTQVLDSTNSWSHTWSIGGSDTSHSGFDFPAMDDNGKNYLYYIAELDAQGHAIEVGGSPIEGYILRGYSANNNTGISNQGVITIFNQAEGPNTINIVIKKTDDAENSTNYLDGAVFKLMYRPDSSGTFENVSNEVVPELDSESEFTVPTAGITLTGLVDGQYQLREISPPAGYVITNAVPVTFTVSEGIITSTEGTITGVKYTAATETSDAEFIIPNTPGVALPNTGGPGTRLFTIFGSFLILGAGVLLWRKRRLI